MIVFMSIEWHGNKAQISKRKCFYDMMTMSVSFWHALIVLTKWIDVENLLSICSPVVIHPTSTKRVAATRFNAKNPFFFCNVTS